jgi:hypothetical protein
MFKMRRILFLVLVVSLAVPNMTAQDIVVNWPAKKLTSQPVSVEQAHSANIRVDDVNDLMFTYSISYQLKPLAVSDFDTIAKAFSIAGAAAAGERAGCDISKVLAAIKALVDAEVEFLNQPATNAGCSESKPCDITLQQALDSWQQTIQPKIAEAQSVLSDFAKACSSDTYKPAVQSASDTIADVLAVVNRPHSIEKSGALELAPDHITSLEIDQIWKGVPTVNGSYSVDIQPSNYRLTLSAGVLFSEVQNRGYSLSVVPSPTGSGTASALSVDGISRFNPTAIALLNYEIPYVDSERIGLALSTGPVFRLGSKSDATSFGYFVGIGVHLYHRFYLTPGYHLGQFADFPTGLYPGEIVPPGLGTPNAVKRWTWRFGIAISYKAKDFGQYGLSGAVNQTNTASSPKTNNASSTAGSNGQKGKSSATPK